MANFSRAYLAQCPHGGDTTTHPATRGIPATLPAREMEAEALALLESDIVTASPGRVSSVRTAIRSRGSYLQTYDELLAGARLAWRNHSRCVGRAIWHTLELRDARHVRTADDVAAECIRHLTESTNGGKLRPTITVFADPGNGPAISIVNRQLIGYAGYRREDRFIGDPANVELTDLAIELGWSAPHGRFDVLPLILSVDGELSWYPVPESAVLRIALSHPDYPHIADLGLTWHANPAVSNMILASGGLRYPAAPFTGWFVATEIGARDLVDHDRYDQLDNVADAVGLSRGRNDLWRDRAMVILTEAVMHSFAQAGVTKIGRASCRERV